MMGLNIEEENRKRGIVPPKGRRVLPVVNRDIERVKKEMKALDFLRSLGYDPDCWDDSYYNNKYYDEDKYEYIALKIEMAIIHDEEVPQEYIDYMLEVKKIKEKYNLE
jgi:hypothetical protein